VSARARAFRAFLTCALGATLCLRVARSEPTSDTYRLAWTRGDGAGACPSEADLARAVETRLRRKPFADTAQRTIEGTVTHAGTSWHAELRVRDERGIVVGSRTLETTGDDCTTLAAETTLAVVLTIDPNAPLVEPSAAENGAATKPAASATVETPCPAAPVATACPKEAPPPPPSAPPECPACRTGKSHVAVALSAVGALGLLPKAAFGAELDAHYEFDGAEAALGLRALPGANTSDGHLGIGLGTASAAGCADVTAGSGVLALCAGAEAGYVTAVALNLTPVRPGNYPWFALAAGPRLVLPRGPLGFELGVQAIVPLTRQRFVVQAPETVGFQTSSLGGVLTLGIRAGPS